MKFLWESLVELSPSSEYSGGTTYDSIICIKGVKPSLEDVEIKNAELEAAEPMRLLRLERNRLLQETDWEITRGLEEGLNIDSLKTYRTALRNLPQQIEAGEITAPTLDDNGMLVFEYWPERTDA